MHSGVALIVVNTKGENTVSVGPGANSRLSPENVIAAAAAIQEADCLLVQLEIPLEAVQAALELAHRHHVRTILNPAPARKIPVEIFKFVDTLTPNETEAAILAGQDPSAVQTDSLSQLASILVVPNLVVTLGSKGACILQNGQMNFISPFSITPLDTSAPTILLRRKCPREPAGTPTYQTREDQHGTISGNSTQRVPRISTR